MLSRSGSSASTPARWWTSCASACSGARRDACCGLLAGACWAGGSGLCGWLLHKRSSLCGFCLALVVAVVAFLRLLWRYGAD